MKYLNSYKLFESTQERVADKIIEVEEIKQTIKDILLPVSDLGYDISVTDNTLDSGPFYIFGQRKHRSL